jgi:hypothetical protein
MTAMRRCAVRRLLSALRPPPEPGDTLATTWGWGRRRSTGQHGGVPAACMARVPGAPGAEHSAPTRHPTKHERTHLHALHAQELQVRVEEAAVREQLLHERCNLRRLVLVRPVRARGGSAARGAKSQSRTPVTSTPEAVLAPAF